MPPLPLRAGTHHEGVVGDDVRLHDGAVPLEKTLQLAQLCVLGQVSHENLAAAAGLEAQPATDIGRAESRAGWQKYRTRFSLLKSVDLSTETDGGSTEHGYHY